MSLGYNMAMSFICKKTWYFNCTKLDRIADSFIVLFQRVNIVKLIQGWYPTHAVLYCQGKEFSPLCPRCHTVVETASHILQSSHPDAISHRQNAMMIMLNSLLKWGTPIHAIITSEHKLSLTLALPYLPQFLCLTLEC